MTVYTVFLGIIPLIQVGLMDVLMTIGAFFTHISEAPFLAPLMTRKTWGCQVSGRQLKFRAVVPFNGEG